MTDARSCASHRRDPPARAHESRMTVRRRLRSRRGKRRPWKQDGGLMRRGWRGMSRVPAGCRLTRPDSRRLTYQPPPPHRLAPHPASHTDTTPHTRRRMCPTRRRRRTRRRRMRHVRASSLSDAVADHPPCLSALTCPSTSPTPRRPCQTSRRPCRVLSWAHGDRWASPMPRRGSPLSPRHAITSAQPILSHGTPPYGTRQCRPARHLPPPTALGLLARGRHGAGPLAVRSSRVRLKARRSLGGLPRPRWLATIAFVPHDSSS